MKNFIEVKAENGQTTLINVQQIACIESLDGVSKVSLSGGTHVMLEMGKNQLLQIIEEATR